MGGRGNVLEDNSKWERKKEKEKTKVSSISDLSETAEVYVQNEQDAGG